jgi:alanine racemase
MYEIHRPTRIEVDLDCIRYNVKSFSKILGEQTLLMAVVKANAYGHGAVPVAKAALEAGANWLGVALIQEAAELRAAGIMEPVLVLGYTVPVDYPYMIAQGIRPAIYTMEQGLAFARAAKELGTKAAVHLKIDTGMGRLGFLPEASALEAIMMLANQPNLIIEGLFTHFARADEADQQDANDQLQCFSQFAAELNKLGLHIPLIHCANTAAAMINPAAHFNMIRLGIGMYGLYPSKISKSWGLSLCEAITLKSCLSHVKNVTIGTGISYGHIWCAARPSVIGTVPIGYGDGILRRLSNRGFVLVRGRRVPMVGRICMDQLMVDLTEVPEASIGDEVVIIGQQGSEKITVDEVAGLLETINYEVTCILNQRIPRHYLNK